MATTRFRTLLVPHDFSPHSEAALDAAAELATSLGAELHLLHVYPPATRTMAPYGDLLPPELIEQIGRAAKQRLQELDRARPDLPIHTRSESGAASETIVRVAEEIGADLIVMGTRGLTGLQHVVLGSVAERVLRTAPCPVLTVQAESA